MNQMCVSIDFYAERLEGAEGCCLLISACWECCKSFEQDGDGVVCDIKHKHCAVIVNLDVQVY